MTLHTGHARMDVNFVHLTGDAVVSEAEAVAAHAEAMRAHATAIDGLTARNGIPAVGGTMLREQAAALSAAAADGERIGRLLQRTGGSNHAQPRAVIGRWT